MSNPWMSVWLSAANAWAGAARGFWTAEMRRQQTAMINEMTCQMVRFWKGLGRSRHPTRGTERAAAKVPTGGMPATRGPLTRQDGDGA